jgi:thymidylate kinase
VKLLQCLVVPGENADAADLVCTPDAFDRFAARIKTLDGPRLRIVAEQTDDLHDSYGMVDPRGGFRQSRPGGYVSSDPIAEVGLDEAWAQVGGCDLERFVARGGVYEHGEVCRGVRTPIIALEGLDGAGKSTLAKVLAKSLGAVLLCSPPKSMSDERARAERLPPAQRRQFYWRGNEEAMRVATDHVFAGERVVVDRCFASTAAYEAAESGKVATLAGLPRRLAAPDLVVFLGVSEAERSRRLRGRGVAQTAEEQRLDRDAAFRQRVVDGYRQLGCVFVDAGGELTDTLEIIRGLLKRFGDGDEYELVAD